MKYLQCVRPVSLLLVDAQQMIEGGIAVFARGRQFLQQAFRPIHQARAQVVECKGKRSLVTQYHGAVLTQAGVNRDCAIGLPAPTEQAAQSELDFRRIAVRIRHTREDLSRVVEAIVDQVIEADVVITRQSDSARRAIAATQYPGGNPDGYE